METSLPEGAVVFGSLKIVVTMSNDGPAISYGLEDMTPESAIGYLTVVTDRLREECSLKWQTCPGCVEDWESHFEDEDDD